MFFVSTAADRQTVAASYGHTDCLTADAETVRRYLQTLSLWNNRQSDSVLCAPETVSVITADTEADRLSEQIACLCRCLGLSETD
jgi:hypothetical protein